MVALARLPEGGLLEEAEAPDERRRRLLEVSDDLLDRVERLRLDDHRALPAELRDAIEGLQRRLGRRDPPVSPATLRAAHELVLGVQARLMAANPRNPSPRRHANRAAGQPLITDISGGGRWKLLAMPLPPPGGDEAQWAELVMATVERAYDRWAYAQHHAAASAREKRPARRVLAAAEVAWRNYTELRSEAERLLVRIPRPSSGGSAARRP
ncbi:MAG: hypothetical protein ACREPA_03910 [Candidatus Dormibacteraceae bacterium]